MKKSGIETRLNQSGNDPAGSSKLPASAETPALMHRKDSDMTVSSHTNTNSISETFPARTCRASRKESAVGQSNDSTDIATAHVCKTGTGNNKRLSDHFPDRAFDVQ